MPRYKYKAADDTGAVRTGIIEGSNAGAARDLVREKGYYPLEIQALAEDAKKRDLELSYRIKTSDLAIFCGQFSVVLKAGISILQALDLMAQQTENKKLKEVLEDVYDRIQKGSGITQAFKEHERRFPEIFISMLEAGEVTGQLDVTLEKMGIALEKEHKLAQKIKNAMIYPVILGVIAFAVVVFLLVAVVPTFSNMYAGAGQELPGLTKGMLALGDFMSQNFILIFFILAMLVILVRVLLRMEDIRYSFDKFKLSIPVIGKLLLKIVTARYTQSMAVLISSGIPLIQALDITSRNLGNEYVSRGVKSLINEVRAGSGLAQPLDKLQIFSPLVIQMTQLGEASGTLDSLLEKTSGFYENEADSAAGRLTALIEPLVIVLMGGVVLVIVLAILLPMFGMFSLIQ